MPYISEIHFLTGDASVEAEFLEITLRPGEDPADYTISFYDVDGALKTTLTATDPNSGSTANILSNGEVNLSSLVGLPDPDNSDFTVYIISGTASGSHLFNGATSGGTEANYVSVYDVTSSSLVQAYGVMSNPTRVLSGGVADGETATQASPSTWPSSGNSIQFDAFGNIYTAARTSGDAVTCFDERTRILTPKGERSLHNLRVGDLVETLDHGAQPIRWIGVTQCSGASLAKSHLLKPVRIPKDFFGPGRPNRTLRVSRQHRLLVHCPAQLPPEVKDGALVPAIRLTDMSGISVQRRPREITYRHLMFDRHQIVCANGIPAESFLAREGAISALPKAAQQDVKALVDEELGTRAARTIIERRAQFLQIVACHRGAKTIVPPWPDLQTCIYSAASA